MYKWHVIVNNSIDVKLIAGSMDEAISLIMETLKLDNRPSFVCQRID